MTTIKVFIPHPNRVEEAAQASDPNQGMGVDDTTSLIAHLCNLQPPMWIILGGGRDTGKTQLLEQCAASNSASIKSHETLIVTLPDEEPSSRRRGDQASDLALTTFRTIYATTYETKSGAGGLFRRRQLNEGELSRQLSFADVFGYVRRRLNDLGIRRLILDNGHYLRHDAYAFRKLFDLRKVLRHPLVLIFGVRIEQDREIEQIFKLNIERMNNAKPPASDSKNDAKPPDAKPPDAKPSVDKLKPSPSPAQATMAPPVVLFSLREDDFPAVLQHVFFDLRALPDKSFEQQEDILIDKLWKATWKGNWVRIEMMTAYLDGELCACDARPRTAERPGVITQELVQRVIDKMQPRIPR
jgi:hypothetical protein